MLRSLSYPDFNACVLHPDESFFAFLQAVLRKKTVRRLHGKNRLLSISADNLSLVELEHHFKTPQITRLLTVFYVLALYFKADAPVRNIVKNLFVASQLSIRTRNAGSFIQRFLCLQRENVMPLLPMKQASSLKPILLYHRLRHLFCNVPRKRANATKAYGAGNRVRDVA